MAVYENTSLMEREDVPEVKVQSGSHLSIWNALKVTAAKFTKKVRFGKREFTAVSPHWQLYKATCQWGPYGYRWGLRNLRYEQYNFAADPHPIPVMALFATFFYETDTGKQAEFEVAVDMPFKIGDDTFKKLQTAARSKALSLVGSDAGVFLGLFDDVGYVDAAIVSYDTQMKDVGRIRKEVSGATTEKELEALRLEIYDMTSSGGMPPHDGRALLEQLDDRLSVVTRKTAAQAA